LAKIKGKYEKSKKIRTGDTRKQGPFWIHPEANIQVNKTGAIDLKKSNGIFSQCQFNRYALYCTMEALDKVNYNITANQGAVHRNIRSNFAVTQGLADTLQDKLTDLLRAKDQNQPGGEVTQLESHLKALLRPEDTDDADGPGQLAQLQKGFVDLLQDDEASVAALKAKLGDMMDEENGEVAKLQKGLAALMSPGNNDQEGSGVITKLKQAVD